MLPGECAASFLGVSSVESKAPRSELMDELNRKRAWVQSATALEFRD